MCQGIFDALHGLADHLLGIKLIAQSEQTIGIVCRLLIAPPVVAVALVRPRDLASPEACVIGVGQCLGVSSQPVVLALEQRLQPPLRMDGINLSHGELTTRLRLNTKLYAVYGS